MKNIISINQETQLSNLMDSKLCRVCLDRTGTISLFDKDENLQYREKIIKCAAVSIEEGDGLPSAICEECASELSACYAFALKCEASDQALRGLDLILLPKGEEIQRQIKLETNDILYYANDTHQYDDNIDRHSDSKTDVQITATIKSKHKRKKNPKKKYYYTKTIPNYLRKNKRKVNTGPIQCMVCGRISSCHSAFELHMRSHTKEKPFICDLCNKSYRTKSTLKIHISKHYSINDRVESETSTLLDQDLRKQSHKVRHLSLECVICRQKASTRSELQIHMRKHTGDKPFSCPNCNKFYSLKTSLKRHIQVIHSKEKCLRFVCEHCGKNFYCRSSIIIHLRIHTGEKPFTCSFCGEQFTQNASLIRHRRGHTGEKPFKCQTCGKAFRDKTLVSKHQMVHSKAKDFICHICSKAFKAKQGLRVHINRHLNPEKFICNFCGMTFTVKGNLTIHVRRAHSENSGVCTVCDKSFSNLAVHMRSHSGEKPHRCKLCDQRFMTARSLSHHFGFKHRNAAKFKCSTGQCEKAFPTIAMLEFHILKAHLDKTPYVCQHCARGFLRPSDLSRHLKVNHLENTHVTSQFIKTVQMFNS